MLFIFGLIFIVVGFFGMAIPSRLLKRKLIAKRALIAKQQEQKQEKEKEQQLPVRDGAGRLRLNDPYSTRNSLIADKVKYDIPSEDTLNIVFLSGIFAGLFGLILVVAAMFYTQDVGESKVQVSWTGELVGQTTDTGLHFKAPWVSVKTFDIRNNVVSYVADGTATYSGNRTTGPQVTFQDREGVTGSMDITLRYSLDPSQVSEIYTDFRSQDVFVTRVITEGVRAEARLAPSTKNTIEVYNDRQGVARDIWVGLEKRWANLGIIIEDVAVQEIRYSTEVTSRFDEAQAARIAIDKAKANKQAASVLADTAVIEAQGRADAQVVEAQGQATSNDILTQSLSQEILTQRYIDALKGGTVFVVPEGSTPLVTTSK